MALHGLWCTAFLALLAMANSATLMATFPSDNTACKTCIDSSTDKPCLNQAKDASYCCTALESSTDCNYCGETTSNVTPLNWMYCPFSDICGTEILTNSPSWSFSIPVPSGDTCVYTIPRTATTGLQSIMVNGTGFLGYLA